MEHKGVAPALMTFVGSVIAFIGYYLPWQSIVFAPPHGFLIINGVEQTAFTYALSGLNPSEAATSSAQFLHATLITLLLIGIADFLKLFLSEDAASHVLKVISSIAHSPVTETTLGFIQAFVHALQAFLIVAFFTLYISMEHLIFPTLVANHLGGGADAVQAGQYASIHLGIGLLAMLVGLAIAGLAVWRKIAVVVGILIVVGIALAIFHSSALGSFFHLMGF